MRLSRTRSSSAYREPLKPGQLAGANYDLHPPSRDATKPIGTWNETRIVARGSHVEPRENEMNEWPGIEKCLSSRLQRHAVHGTILQIQ